MRCEHRSNINISSIVKVDQVCSRENCISGKFLFCSTFAATVSRPDWMW